MKVFHYFITDARIKNHDLLIDLSLMISLKYFLSILLVDNSEAYLHVRVPVRLRDTHDFLSVLIPTV